MNGWLVNLFCLLIGFELLACHLEKSHVPVILPKFLSDDWKGGFVLLVTVFAISSFLDNIAAALVGGAMRVAAVNRKFQQKSKRAAQAAFLLGLRQARHGITHCK